MLRHAAKRALVSLGAASLEQQQGRSRQQQQQPLRRGALALEASAVSRARGATHISEAIEDVGDQGSRAVWGVGGAPP